MSVEAFTLFGSFLIGSAVGSFLNVAVSRGARKESFGGRSYCESCHEALSFRELMPIASFFIQKGRCRHCGIALSWYYPFIEGVTALSFAATAWIFLPQSPIDMGAGEIVKFLLIFLGVAAAIVIFFSDLRYTLIPTGPVLLLTALGTVSSIARVESSGWDTLLLDGGTAACLSLLLGFLWFASRGKWMGLGDAKLVFPVSLILGFPASLTAFLFSFWLGGAVGLLLLLFRVKTLKDQIPFGPFILAGTVGAYFFHPYFSSIFLLF